MGVFEQRYSSTLLSILVSASLIFSTPVAAGPAPLTVQFADAGTQIAEDEVPLPPIMQAFLTLVLSICNLGDRPEAIEPEDFRPFRKEDQLVRLITAASELPRIYGDVQEYTGKPIESLDEYVHIVEPTHVNTGTLTGDGEALFQLLRRGGLKPAAKVTRRESFASVEVWAQARVYEFNKAQKIENTLASLSTDGLTGNMDSTVVFSLIRGMVGVAMTGVGVSSVLRQISEAAKKAESGAPAAPAATPEGSPAPRPANAAPRFDRDKIFAEDFVAMTDYPDYLPKSRKREWFTKREEASRKFAADKNAWVEYSFPRPPAAAPAVSAPSVATALVGSGVGLFTLSGIASATSAGADLMDSYQSISRIDGEFLNLVRKIEALEPEGQLKLIRNAEDQVRSFVLPQINRIAARISNNNNLQSEESGEAGEMARILLSYYPATLESDAIRNFFGDALKLKLDTSDQGLARILLKNYDAMAIQFFQTLKVDGPLEQIFESFRDEGRKVPYETVKKIMDEDQNHYPLVNMSRTPFASGKLFQVHTADYKNADGTTTPVVVRILFPGSEESLDRARVRLGRLAGRIREALIRADGTGPSLRRVREAIEMSYRNLRVEPKVEATVHNQVRGKRIERDDTVDLPSGETAKLRVRVPNAYPALPGSKVMVMERVNKIVKRKKMVRDNPEVVAAFLDVILRATYLEMLIAPMQAAEKDGLNADEAAKKAVEQALTGMFHCDLHTGNILFTAPEMDGDQLVYTAYVIDWGLVAWITQDQVKELTTLAVGASYNHAGFLNQSLWRLKSPAMDKWTAEAQAKAKAELEALVSKKINELSVTGTYWSAAEWIRYVWEKETIDFPSWLLLMKQGHNAIESSRKALGIHPSEMAKVESKIAQEHRKTTYDFLKRRLKGASWWPVYRYEAMAWARGCARAILGRAQDT